MAYPSKMNSEDCLLVIGHICVELHGFHGTFTNIVMLLYFLFPSAMPEEGKARIVWDSF